MEKGGQLKDRVKPGNVIDGELVPSRTPVAIASNLEPTTTKPQNPESQKRLQDLSPKLPRLNSNKSLERGTEFTQAFSN